jgi:hypothetical protein
LQEEAKMKISSYAFGKIIINGSEYNADLIIFPDTIYQSWWRKEGHSLCMEDLKEVLSRDIKILVVGTGSYGKMKVPESLIQELRNKGIETIIKETDKAVELFNTLISEGKKVAGAFHLTC